MKRIYFPILAMFLFVNIARGAEVEVLKPKGNLEIKLANLHADTGTHRLQDLLPLPFDARLL